MVQILYFLVLLLQAAARVEQVQGTVKQVALVVVLVVM